MNETKSRAPSDAAGTWPQLAFNFIFKARWLRLENRADDRRCFRKVPPDRWEKSDRFAKNADAGLKPVGALQSCSSDRHGTTSTNCKASVANNRQAHRRERRGGKAHQPIHYKTLIHFKVTQISFHSSWAAQIDWPPARNMFFLASHLKKPAQFTAGCVYVVIVNE